MQEQYLSAFTAFFASVWTALTALQMLDLLMLLGALLAIAGLLLFLRADQTTRQRHEREFQLHCADREFALRREVYLPAAEAIARAQDFLSRFPALDISQDQGQIVVDHVLAALGKAQLVATEASVRPVMAVAAEFSNSYLSLSARRQPIAALDDEVRDLEDRIGQLSVERDHLLASITRMAGGDPAEQANAWSEMNLRFDRLHREIGMLLDQRKSKLTKRSRLRREFTLEAAQCALRIAKLGVPAYLALREELHLGVDEVEYRAAAHRRIGEIERYLKELTRPADAPPPRREPVVKPDEAPQEQQLRVVLKRSG